MIFSGCLDLVPILCLHFTRTGHRLPLLPHLHLQIGSPMHLFRLHDRLGLRVHACGRNSLADLCGLSRTGRGQGSHVDQLRGLHAGLVLIAVQEQQGVQEGSKGHCRSDRARRSSHRFLHLAHCGVQSWKHQGVDCACCCAFGFGRMVGELCRS